MLLVLIKYFRLINIYYFIILKKKKKLYNNANIYLKIQAAEIKYVFFFFLTNLFYYFQQTYFMILYIKVRNYNKWI